MNRLLPVLLALLVADLAVGAGTNEQQMDVSVFSRLTNGMSLVEFQKTLGILGRQEENSSPIEASYDFDYNGEWILATVQTHPPPAVVKQFRLIKDGLTIEERQVQRRKDWSEWVAKHHRQTNGIPKKIKPVGTEVPTADTNSPVVVRVGKLPQSEWHHPLVAGLVAPGVQGCLDVIEGGNPPKQIILIYPKEMKLPSETNTLVEVKGHLHMIQTEVPSNLEKKDIFKNEVIAVTSWRYVVLPP